MVSRKVDITGGIIGFLLGLGLPAMNVITPLAGALMVVLALLLILLVIRRRLRRINSPPRGHIDVT